jgi:hypothetical protein
MPARTPHSALRAARRLIALGAIAATLVVAGTAAAAPARIAAKSCTIWLPIVGSIEVEHGTTITTPGGARIVCDRGTWKVVLFGR